MISDGKYDNVMIVFFLGLWLKKVSLYAKCIEGVHVGCSQTLHAGGPYSTTARFFLVAGRQVRALKTEKLERIIEK